MAPQHGNPLRQTTLPVRRSLLQRFSTVILLVSALLFLCNTASAIRFDAFVGFNGVVPEGNWFPVACEVQNDGPTLNAIIEVSSSVGGGQARRIPIELTTGSTKRVIIPAFATSRYSTWTVRLLTDRGKTMAEQTLGRDAVKNVSWGTPYIAALARTMAGSPILPQPKNRNQPEQNPTVTRLQAPFFPDNPIALEGLETLYLNTETALDLKMPQVQALLAWVDSGGHLIVGIERAGDVDGTPWLKGLLPCEVSSTAVIKSGDAFDRYLKQTAIVTPDEASAPAKKKNSKRADKVISTAGTTPINADTVFNGADLPILVSKVSDGDVLLEQQGHPLIIAKSQGRGRVTALTFSPEREPFLSWKNRNWFWAHVAQIPDKFFESTDYYYYGGWSIDGIFGAMVDSKQIRKLPLAWLLLLLLVYLVVIGPFDRWWLKKINRQMLTWITFPLYVVYFSALIYFIGFKLRAGDSEWNEIHVVDVLPQGTKSVLRGRTFASIYSPSNARYPLSSGQPFATLRGEYMANNYGNGQESSQADVIQHGNNFDAEVSVPVWTSQLYVSDWLQAGENPFTVETSATGDTLQVQIDNKLDHALTEVSVIYDGRVYTVGEVGSGTKKFSLETSKGVLLKDFVRNHASGLRDAVQQRHNTFGDNRPTISNVPLGAMAACFPSQMNDAGNAYQNFQSPLGLDLSRWADAGDTILLAWDANHSLTKPVNQFSPRRLHRDTLLRLVIPRNS